MACSPIGQREAPTANTVIGEVPLESLMAHSRMETYNHDPNKYKNCHYLQGTELSHQKTNKVNR